MKDMVGWCERYEVLFCPKMTLKQVEKANQGTSNCLRLT